MGNKKSREVEFSAEAELTEEQIDLLIKSTGYSKDEIVDFHTNYAKLYPSGMINVEQFQTLYKQLFPFKELDSNTIATIFNAFDDNQSGEICFTEFLTAISISGKADPEQKLHLAFKMYDNNHNGQLEMAEIYYIMKALRDVTDKDNEEELDLLKWDTNNNGYLTEEEFVSFIQSDPNIYKHFLNIVKLND